jgi:hypothetical protein
MPAPNRLVMKELRAVVDERTSMVCLSCAGQIRPVDEPFDTLVGPLMRPPFHVHCRSISVPWMFGFGHDLVHLARAEKARRSPKEKKHLPPPP